MTPDDQADQEEFKKKIEAMRMASKNPLASMTMKMKRFVEVQKEQAKHSADDLSSTQVAMSMPKKPVPQTISQAKIQAGQMKAPQKPEEKPAAPKAPEAGVTGKFEKLVEISKAQAAEKEDLSATQVVFLGTRRNPDRVRPAKPETPKRPTIKVVDIGGGFMGQSRKKEEEPEAPKPLPEDPADYDQATLMNAISSIDQFSNMSQAQLARLSKCKMEQWGPEEFIFREGGSNVDKMVLVLNGTVFIRKRLMKDGKEKYEQIAEIPAPTIIGENSFFTGLGRSAGVYARQKVSGIIITKEDIMRLISLEKPRMIDLFVKIAEENIERCRKTAQLYMSTLQLLWNQATTFNFSYHGRIKELDRKLDFVRGDIDKIQDLVREVLVVIRELNVMLEELYEFANLPVIAIQKVDFDKVSFPATQQSLRVLQSVLEDLKMQSEFVSLNAINFKDVILNAVIRTQEKGVMVNYSAIISLSKTAYNEFARRYKEFGFEIKFLSSEEADTLLHKKENANLWDMDQPLFPGR
ncbi:MAG: cyclic nucleotide-binding domain-containing protein [Nitrospinota bacterium]|nr:cyclic nucleotide-binding domain-containing protein [Nitrospinota bacterium]